MPVKFHLDRLFSNSVVAATFFAASLGAGTAGAAGDAAAVVVKAPEGVTPREVGFVDGEPFHFENVVAPGVKHVFESETSGPLTINFVQVDLTRKDLEIEGEKAKDLMRAGETMPAMVKRMDRPGNRVVAALNADFFDGTHTMVGAFVDEDVIWRGPWVSKSGRMRPVFAMDADRKVFIGVPKWSTQLRGAGDGDALEIDGVNFPTNERENKVLAYTWPLGKTAPKLPAGSTQIVLKLKEPRWILNERAEAVVSRVAAAGEATTSATLDRHTVVLHVKGAPPAWVKPEALVALDARLGGLEKPVGVVLGGLPTLIEDGKVVVKEAAEREGAGASFATDLHPRSAIGVSKDGKTLTLLCVDGRQPGLSMGADLYKMAKLLQDAGCYNAMNFDGGGSSAIMVRGGLGNFPSDATGPRAVSNAIVVRRVAKPGKPSQVLFWPKEVLVAPGASFRLGVSAYDSDGEPTYQVPGFTWALTGGAGVDANGNERMISVAKDSTAGTWTLEAKDPAGEVLGSAKITVDAPFLATAAPEAVLLKTGDHAKISFAAKTTTGQAFTSMPGLWTVSVPPFLFYDAKEATLLAKGPGVGVVRGTLAGVSAEIPVAVDTFDEHVHDVFEDAPNADPKKALEGTKFDEKATKLERIADLRKVGAAAWRLTYKQSKGGVARITIPVKAKLEGTPEGVGVWVYGDGEGHALRGEVRDARGRRYTVSFTDLAGISWKDEWRFLPASLATMSSRSAGPGDKPRPPFTLQSLSLVEENDAKKSSGSIVLDGLAALNVPAGKH